MTIPSYILKRQQKKKKLMELINISKKIKTKESNMDRYIKSDTNIYHPNNPYYSKYG